MSSAPKKLLLIRQTVSNTKDMICTSYALAILNSQMKSRYDVKILDNNGKYKTYSDGQIMNAIKEYMPDFIGFNINMYNAYFSYRLIRLINSNFQDIPLIAGGVHTNQCYEEISELPVIVVRGEAETTLAPLLSTLNESYFQNGRSYDEDVYNALSTVKGITFRKNDNMIVNTGMQDIEENLDKLPFASYDGYNLEDFLRKTSDQYGSVNSIITQRGCPFSCIYCKSDDMGGKIREASPEYIVNYIEYIYSNFGCKHIYIMDDNFTLTRERILKFCDLFIKSQLHKKVSLECQTNILCPLDNEMLTAMLDANFKRLQFGIDRFTDFGVKKAGIRPNNKSLIPKLELLKSKGMKTMFTVLLGMDFDTKDTIQSEYEKLKTIKDYAQVFGVSFTIPVPGTKLYNRHPEVERWYLDTDFNEVGVHYYDLVLSTHVKAYTNNLFKHPKAILHQVMKIQFYSIKNNCLNLFGNKGLIIYYADKCLILLSYYLSKISPKTELLLFKVIRSLRMILVKLAYRFVYYAK